MSKKRNTKFTDSFSEEIYKQTYKYHTDNDINDTHLRIAKDLASIEKDPEYWTEKFLDILEDFKFVPGGRINSNAGTGLKGTTYINCFHKSAKVLTDRGYVTIDQVQVGDKVLTHKGRWKKVVNAYHRPYKGKAFAYTSSNLTHDLISTPEHPFYQGGEKWLTAKENHNLLLLKDNHYNHSEVKIDLFEFLKNHSNFLKNRTLNSDSQTLWTEYSCEGGNGANIVRKSEAVKRYITIDTHLAYALGRFVGDGSTFLVNKNTETECDGFNIVFSKKEIEELIYIRNVLESNFGIELNLNESKEQNCLYLRKNNIIVSTFLRTLCGNGFDKKKIPSYIWQAPKSIQESFLLGLFDADGCVTSKMDAKIVLNNENLIDDVQALFLSIGIPTVKRKESNNAAFGVFLSKLLGESFIKQSRKQYDDDRISAERTYPKDMTSRLSVSLEKMNGEDVVLVKNFEKIEIDYDDDVYNISVEEDESYIVNNVIVHNCFVDGFTGQNQDSMDGIMDALKRQAMILKSEGGYGFCADVMRPRGAFIGGIGVEGPGAVKMLDMWDKQSEVITAGSGEAKKEKKGKNKIRKGAQMVTMSVFHPDVEEFITAKQAPGRLTKFNMSVLVSDEFMHAVENNLPWNLEFPETDHEKYDAEWDGNLKKWKEKGYPTKIYKTYENANELWDLIMKSTYNRNEPGVLFVDTMNKMNNLRYCEYISATNPCGEQILPIGGVCLLGSINLTQFVDLAKGDWDYEKLKEMIPTIVRFMDNVNDKTNVPLPSQKDNLVNKRRIGLGYMGYASALLMMKVRYGSERALELTNKLGSFVINEAYKSSALIAKEKGSFKLYDQDKFLQSEFVKMALLPETIEVIKKNGLRNSHLASIQPTGNSSIYANNVSGGLEPIFMPEYIRTSIVPHRPEGMTIPVVDWSNKIYKYPEGVNPETATKWEWVKEGDENLLLTKFEGSIYKIDHSRGLLKETKVQDYAVRVLSEKGEWDPNADWAADASKLDLDAHVLTMKVFAKYIDSAMSKTVNLPNSFPYEEFKNLYTDVYKTGIIKGCTTYRAGTMTAVLAAESTASDKEKKNEEPSATAELPKTTAPKRPKSLPCDIYQLTAAGQKWVVFIGLMGGRPYEVFAFKSERLGLPSSLTQGILTKSKKGGNSSYDLECPDGWTLRDLKTHFESDEQEALTRMISTSLRHGADPEFVVAQLQKSEGTVVSFSKAIARTLKKYISEEGVTTVKCSECGSKDVRMQEGCFVCVSCGSSKCS